MQKASGHSNLTADLVWIRQNNEYERFTSLTLPPLRRVIVMGLDQAKWSQTYKFAQTVLKYYEKV